MSKTVGIIGGMGPDATVELMQHIIAETPAEDDKDHIHMLVDSNPNIPSRRNAILFGGPSPETELVNMAKRLEAMGANFIVMPCNTAHYYYSAINNAISIDCWHLIELTAQSIARRYPHIKRIGLLATVMSKQLQLFEPCFQSQNIDIIYPDERVQEIITQTILAVKKSKVNNELLTAYNQAIAKLNHDYLLLGCSELSVLHSPFRTKALIDTVTFIDPIQLLAQTIVNEKN